MTTDIQDQIERHRPLTPKERGIFLLCLMKMRLICNALASHGKDLPQKDLEPTGPKLGELEEILAESLAADGGRKAVIFSQWANMLALTEPIIQRVGLNLQSASLVINLDLPWTPAVLEQRIARAHRHGQPSSVQVINLVAKDTIEERMLDTLAAKKNVFASVFGTDEAPTALRFEDMGQSLMQKLGELLKKPAEVELELAPTEPTEPAPAERVEAPTLKDFAALHSDREPAADLPSPRLVQAELVEKSQLPADPSLKLSQARDLTPARNPRPSPPPPAKPCSKRPGNWSTWCWSRS